MDPHNTVLYYPQLSLLIGLVTEKQSLGQSQDNPQAGHFGSMNVLLNNQSLYLVFPHWQLLLYFQLLCYGETWVRLEKVRGPAVF